MENIVARVSENRDVVVNKEFVCFRAALHLQDGVSYDISLSLAE